MTFCTKCGRQLADGQVCTCQQNIAQPAQQPNIPQGMNYNQPQYQQAQPQYQQTQAQPQYQQAQPQYQQPQAQPQYQQASQPQYQQPQQPQYQQAQPQYQQPQAQPQPQQQAPQLSVQFQPQQPKGGANIGGAFKSIFQLFKKSIKNPFGASEEFYENANLASSIIPIGLIAILYMVATLFNFVAKSVHYLWITDYATAHKLFGITIWNVLDDFGITWVDIIQSFFFPIIYVAVMTGVIIGFSILVSKVILKKGLGIKKALALCAAVSAPIMVILVIKMFSNFIFVRAVNSTIISITTTCLSFLSLLEGLNIIHKEIQNRNKMLIALAIGVAGLIIVNYLLDVLVMGHCQTTFAFPM